MTTKSKTQIMSHDDTVMSPITKASNVLFEDGETAQDKLEDNVEKSFTPSVENSSSMFKVGQGDNVDYSGNVVDGAYVSCVLKGKTMVNCIQESSSQDVILPYEFTEGQYVTINETKESGALGVELKGQTLVNLVDKIQHAWGGTGLTLTRDSGYTELSVTETALWYQTSVKHTGLIKLSTTYLAILEVVENTLATPFTLTGNANDGKFLMVNNIVRAGQTGIFKIKLNSKPTFDTSGANRFDLFMQFGKNESVGNKIKLRLMLIEYQEGMENWDIPYFEGMTSVKAPTVKTVGKNLFDIKNAEELSGWGQHGFELLSNGVAFHARSGWNAIGYRFPSLRNKTVTVTADVTLNVLTNNKNLTQECGIGNKAYIPQKTLSNNTTERVATTFTLGGDGIVWLFGSSSPENTGYGSSDVKWSFTNIQVEEGSTATTYEPHTSSSLTIPNEVVLRSLPNGVCDTFNTRTGEYVRRVGEKTLNGSESWGVWQQGGDHLTQKTVVGFGLNLEDAPTTKSFYVLCDRFATGGTTSGADNDHSYYVYHKELIYGYYANASTYRRLGLSVSKTKLGIPNDNTDATQALVSLRAYLASNPIKVQYELATPIITKLPLQSTLKPWNTTTHIYTEIPQNSLYPILSHSNPTYPVILKPSTKYSIVANSYSNNHTNSPINFNLGGATASTTVGNRVTMVTTPSTLSNDLLTMSGKGNKLNNVMVIEGGVVGDEPYFEGICDVKSPILSNTGKNLINALNCSARMGAIILSKEQNCITFKTPNAWGGLVYHLYLKPNTTYTFSFEGDSVDTRGYVRYKTGMSDWSGGYGGSNKYTFTTDGLGVVMFTIESATVRDSVTVKNIMIEEATTKNLYEPHKSNTTTFDQKDGKTIVLRSLPSGVCDTLNVETGEYVRRIGEKTLNGEENGWYAWVGVENDSYKAFALGGWVTDSKEGNHTVIGNKLSNQFIEAPSTSQKGEWFMTYRGMNAIWIAFNIAKSKLVDTTVASFISYLKQKTITVQYELATPIISTIDVQGFPHAYKDGHVQLSSGYNGQSLTPKIEYSLPINRNCQIRTNQAMVERHQKQIDELQAIILANLVNNQYKQTLATLQYELSRV